MERHSLQGAQHAQSTQGGNRMDAQTQISRGLQVLAADGQLVGTVERVDADDLHVGGMHLPLAAVDRVEERAVYLRQPSDYYRPERYGAVAETVDMAGQAGQPGRREALRVPEMEERLRVETREAEVGEVSVEQHVTHEQQQMPVDLEREEVTVDRREVVERPLDRDEAAQAFEGGTIRIPVRAEEAVVSKQTVQTGEVLVEKERHTEREQVSDTVLRTHVHVDEDRERAH
jgi:uncharacterized protein (TIGR02271 family)